MAESVIKTYFPSQVVSDAEKLSYDYGLKVAKAIETEWFYTDYNQNTRYTTTQNNFHIKMNYLLTVICLILI